MYSRRGNGAVQRIGTDRHPDVSGHGRPVFGLRNQSQMDERHVRQILNPTNQQKMESEQKKNSFFILKILPILCYVHSSLEESNEMLFAQTQNTQRFYRN